MTKDIEEIQKFVIDASERLKFELERAEDWGDAIKYNFIKGQLDILGKVRNLTDGSLILNKWEI